MVAGDQDVAAKPDRPQKRRMATLYVGLAQHDRLLESGIHRDVWAQRGLSRQPRAVPGSRRADWLEPITDANAGLRIGDKAIYWLAYLHFGRIGGIGIPCSVRSGLCDWTMKSVWAILGLAPAAMFATGTLMWWNRVVRTKVR